MTTGDPGKRKGSGKYKDMWLGKLKRLFVVIFCRSLTRPVKEAHQILFSLPVSGLFMSVGVLSPWMKINLNAVTPQILGSRGTPSKFVLYVLKDMYAKFGAFTRFVTIFVNFDANGLDY